MSAYRAGFSYVLPSNTGGAGGGASYSIEPAHIPIYEGVYAQAQIVMTMAGDGVHAVGSFLPIGLKVK